MPAFADHELDDAFRRVSSGERELIEPVFRLLWPRVVAYCKRRLGNESAAEDAAQRALIKMFEQAPSYDAKKPAWGFAFTLAYYECLTARKTEARARLKGDVPLDTLDATDESPEEMLSGAQLSARARGLVAELSPEERAMLEGREDALDGYLRDLNPTALRKRKQRLLDRLRTAFKQITDPGASR